MMRFLAILLLLLLTGISSAQSILQAYPQETARFIELMVKKHQFDREQVRDILAHTFSDPEVIAKITRPYEEKPWYYYRDHFLTEERINTGAHYWLTHQAILQKAEKDYAVPARIIVGILGVETDFGQKTGNFKALNALATLAFAGPSRRDFFTQELESFLVLSRAQHWQPTKINASYAGAIGWPQFMPSSYLNYAVDFNHSGKKNLLTDSDDVIASIAYYLQQYGWQPHLPVAIKASVTGTTYKDYVSATNEPHTLLSTLLTHGIKPEENVDSKNNYVLFELDNNTQPEYWLGTQNFYVISRYNDSKNYIMAVEELGEMIEIRVKQYAKIKHSATASSTGKS